MNSVCAGCGATSNSENFFCGSCGFDIVTGTIQSNPDSSNVPKEVIKPDDVAEIVEPDPSKEPDEVVEIVEPDQVSDISRIVPEPYSPPETSPVKVEVSVSKDFYEKAVSGEVAYPVLEREVINLELISNEIRVGRQDADRGIYPDVDISKLTQDSAVSVQHCVVNVSANGDMHITDQGSTNGTYVGFISAQALQPYVETEIFSGQPIYLGAWTQIIITVD